MKICSNCGASNTDAAKFCIECGTAQAPVTAPKSPTVSPTIPATKSPTLPPTVPGAGGMNPTSLAQTLASKMAALQNKRRADIMFVLDCTGSMQGEIDAIKDAIADFADTITSEGVRVRVGLIEYRDRLNREEHRVVTFGGQVFTDDPVSFRREVGTLRASGGGDEPESSLDALMLALCQPFAPDVNKVIVLVTDAPPHIPDLETKSIEEVVQAIRNVNLQQLYLLIRTQDPNSQIYIKLLESTRGMAFDLGEGDDFRSRAEDFKRTLMALGKTISQATR